jgi:hypothetical protein
MGHFMLTRFTALTAILLFASLAIAEDGADIKLGDETTSRWRFGVVVKAPGGAVTGITATLPVPTDWPEQQVKQIAEELSPLVGKVSYRTLDGVKQMLVTIPRLAKGEEASAIVELEITKREILEPANLAGLVVPRLRTDLAKYLRPSPYIESTDPKIRSLAAEIVAGKESAWQEAEAVYSWVRANVKYEFSPDIKPAISALKEGHGDCEELSSLFIALCRAGKIPARAVWVPEHCYPEFYLQDAKGAGHWYPCQAAGANHDFGRMGENRPILQKGDNFKIPEERLPQRYVKQTLRAANAQAAPEVRFIMQQVEDGPPAASASQQK